MKPLSPKALANLAAKVSNDIHEDINCGETRDELRQCISWWADQHVKAHCRATLAENEAMTNKLILLGLLMIVKDTPTAPLLREQVISMAEDIERRPLAP